MMVDIVCMFIDRPFSHSGPEFTYVDTGFDLTPYTWLVLQVNIFAIHVLVYVLFLRAFLVNQSINLFVTTKHTSTK